MSFTGHSKHKEETFDDIKIIMSKLMLMQL